jgi:2-polyprenyl-6-methoxyphenol hydroxylase-like FAD-dependent oxidoreductase
MIGKNVNLDLNLFCITVEKLAHKTDSHAIVIGGSIAGLLSARVLADYFSAVTIVERDRLPTQPDTRKEVPQSVQPHVLFARGYRILEQLFPGIGTKLAEKSALEIDWVREFHHFGAAGWSLNAVTSFEMAPSEIVSFTCSRPLLEWAIRQQLAKLPNVRIVDGRRVIGLLGNKTKERVTGVSLRSLTSNASEQLTASLVVEPADAVLNLLNG